LYYIDFNSPNPTQTLVTNFGTAMFFLGTALDDSEGKLYLSGMNIQEMSRSVWVIEIPSGEITAKYVAGLSANEPAIMLESFVYP